MPMALNPTATIVPVLALLAALRARALSTPNDREHRRI